MKIVSLIMILFLTMSGVFAQVVIGSSQYETMKQSNQLSGVNLVSDPTLFDPAGFTPVFSPPTISSGNRSACDCYSEPDSTYTLAMQPNDDGSSALIATPFDFCFYGQTFNAFYINNNGNITFTSILSAFSSSAFPSAGNEILAPFWADVDTRGGNGQVLYKVTPTAVYINWEDVGYFSQQGDKLNTFQLIITDGADPVVNGGNVAFCYQDMQWTTGSASQGVNGFGGVPATCGANKGDNIGYFLISQFDHPGVDFDGALGNPDGISWLDYKSFYFDLCNSGNVPPIPEGISSCDTFKVCSFGDTADIAINFLSPEINQSTSITYTNGGLTTLQQISNTPGNTAELILRIIGDPGSAGAYDITVTATDNFMPTPAVTTTTFVIVIEDSPVPINPILTPTEGCDSILVTALNGPFDTYLWDDFETDTSTYISQSGLSGVTVSLNGCYKRVDELFTISNTPMFNLQGNLSVCPGQEANVFIPDSMNLDSVTWNLPNLAQDTIFSNSLGAGTYNVTIWDLSGLCPNDTMFTVVEATSSVIFATDTLCSGTDTYQVTGLSNAPGTWFSSSPNLVFSSNTDVNPLITSLAPGTYTVSYIDNCNTGDTAMLTFVELPSIFNDTALCQLDYQIAGTTVWPANGVWSEPTGNVSFGPSNTNLNPLVTTSTTGIYNLTFTDDLCGNTAMSSIEFIADPEIFDDTVVCNFGMNVSGTVVYGNGVWSSTDPNISFSDPTLNNPTISSTTSGVYTVSFTDNTCNTEVTANIDFPVLPVVMNDTAVCSLTVPATGTVAYSTGGTWSEPTGNISFSPSATTLNPTFTGTVSGIYTLTFTDEICGNTDDVQVEFIAAPIIFGDTLVCNYGMFVSNTVSHSGGIWTASDTTVNFTDSSLSNPGIGVTYPGTYTVTFTDNSCNFSVSSEIEFPPYAWTDINDSAVCFGTEIVLQANENWTVDDYIWNTGETGSSIVVSVPGVYTVTGSNICHSVTDDAIFSNKPCDINAPNASSLSSSAGINLWFVDQDGIKEFNCIIVNRWGNVIFETNDPAGIWDGRTKGGNKVEEGTYFYTIKSILDNGEPLDKQGFIQVIH